MMMDLSSVAVWFRRPILKSTLYLPKSKPARTWAWKKQWRWLESPVLQLCLTISGTWLPDPRRSIIMIQPHHVIPTAWRWLQNLRKSTSITKRSSSQTFGLRTKEKISTVSCRYVECRPSLSLQLMNLTRQLRFSETFKISSRC